QRRVAALVSAARVRAVHRRRDGDAAAAPLAPRARLAGAQGALLPAPGAHGLRPSRHRLGGLRGHARLRGRRARRAHPAAGHAGGHLRRHDAAARAVRRVDRPALGAPPARGRRLMLNIRRFIVFGHDLLAAVVAWIAAFWLRFNLDFPDEYRGVMLELLPYVLVMHAAVFWL